MSKIQELLAQQKKGISNVSANEKPATIESVTQHTDKKEQPYVEIKTEQPKQLSLAERLRAGKKSGISGNSGTSVVEQGFIENDKPNKTTEKTQALSDTDRPELLKDGSIGSLAEQRHGNSDNQNQDKAAEEIMPSGLSLMAQMKWKREHAPQQNKPSPQPNPSANNVGLADKKEIVQNIPSTESIELSASKATDDQKSNDGTINIEELKHNLAYLANNIESKELVSSIVRTIAVQLKSTPELTKHMSDGDFNLMVRGLRMGYQVAAMAKQNKEEAKKKASRGSGELDQMFKAAGIDFSF